jgi:hypothetical protein
MAPSRALLAQVMVGMEACVWQVGQGPAESEQAAPSWSGAGTVGSIVDVERRPVPSACGRERGSFDGACLFLLG